MAQYDQLPVSSPINFTNPLVSAQGSPFSDNVGGGGMDSVVWSANTLLPTTEVHSPQHGTAIIPSLPANTVSSPASESKSPHSTTTPSAPSASPSHHEFKSNPKKRKVSMDDDDDDLPDKAGIGKGGKKTAHNMIEKRYRNNLNDKIAALRDAVPSLRVMCRNASEGDEDDAEDLEGLAPAHKLNKATVLSKATEYIRHLEKQKGKMEATITEQQNQINHLQRLINSGAFPFQPPVQTPDTTRFSEDMFPRPTAGPQSPAEGLIPTPENLAHMRRMQLAPTPFNAPYASYPGGYPRQQQKSSPRRSNFGGMNRYGQTVLGGLATVMLLDGFAHEEHDSGTNDIASRGLFSLPFNVLRMLTQSSVKVGTLPAVDILTILRLGLIVLAFGYLMAPLFNFKPQPKKKQVAHFVKTDYSLASPVELRHKAWLTAIQTVWVPRHSFVLELAALCLKTVKLSIRKLIGWDGYSFLTGFTKDQEIARVKAWSIALDAQLTGGDEEISISRLILTLLASGTLPSTPSRLMLKALHIRVLFWEAANAGYGSWFMLDELSAKIARWYWKAARSELEAHRNQESSDMGDDYSLPQHLEKLLELESDDVFVDTVVQRGYNLAWNLPTNDKTEKDEAMDAVANDLHIASPLDAVAAWWSTSVINGILSHSLEGDEVDQSAMLQDLQLAHDTAPPPSAARTRALVARAVLCKEERESHLRAAMDGIPHSKTNEPEADSASAISCSANFIREEPLPVDLRNALSFSKCLSLADSSASGTNLLATSFLNNLHHLNTYSLLSTTACILVLERFTASDDLLNDARVGLERLSSGLRLWLGSPAGEALKLPRSARMKTIQRCLNAGYVVMGVEADSSTDLGYVSQSDEDEEHLDKNLSISSTKSTNFNADSGAVDVK